MTARNTANEQWIERLRNVECPDSSYLRGSPALVFERALGSYIYDVTGKEYIDLCAGFGVMALGHHDSVVAQRLRDYLSGSAPGVVHAMGDVYPSRPKIEFLETLRGFLPKHLTRGALALGGGQAVEIAVKTALLASKGRRGFIAFDQSYHGLDLGILPLTYRRDFKAPFAPWLPESCVISLPYAADADAVEQAVTAQKKSGIGTAAIIVEPIQGRAGVCLPPPGWLAMLRELCDRHDVLLIFDEIFVGIGRAGVWSHAAEVAADLVCFGKAIGGGLPLSACFGTERVMQAWPENQGEAIHTGTFFGHSLACFLGKVTLQEIAQRDLVARAQKVGAWWQEHLRRELAGLAGVQGVRGQGLMLAIKFAAPGHAARLMDVLRADGVIALPSGPLADCLSLTPALNIEVDLLTEATARIKTAIMRL